MLMLVAFDVIEQDATGQTKDPDQLQEGAPTARFLGAGLRIGALVLGRVGSGDAGAVDDLGVEAAPIPWGAGEERFDARRDGMAEAGERVQGQAPAGLAVGAGARVDVAEAVEPEAGAGVADDLAAGAAGMEDLIEEAPEGAAAREDPLAAGGALLGRGEEAGGQELAEPAFELKETVLAHRLAAAATGREAGAEPGEEGGVH
jgi:hypothetical protein